MLNELAIRSERFYHKKTNKQTNKKRANPSKSSFVVVVVEFVVAAAAAAFIYVSSGNYRLDWVGGGDGGGEVAGVGWLVGIGFGWEGGWFFVCLVSETGLFCFVLVFFFFFWRERLVSY